MKARFQILMSMAAWVLALGIVIYSAVSFPPQVIEANVPPPIFDTSPTLDILASKILAKSVAPLAHPNGQFPSAPKAADRVYLPLILRSPAPVTTEEWTQHAHDAQRTSYTPQVVPPPWRWKWAWNGPDASGGISAGKTGLPRNSQPVTGGGRVYIAAGSRGVFALNNANGAVVWNRTLGGSINSTPAYDDQTSAVFVLASNGTLYKLDAATGNTLGQFATGASSSLPLPPAIANDRVFISMGTKVYALNKFTLAQVWTYEAGSPVHTPPAYSLSRDRVIAVSQDLFVHAINNTNGSRAWRVKPTNRVSGDPSSSPSNNYATASWGWPVVADVHGYVLVKYQLDWQTLWTWSPWPTTNSAIRANLYNQPTQQALFVLDLDDGTIPFVANVGHGGWGDGGDLPMGPQPVVKRLANGGEVVYTVGRGNTTYDGRWDSVFVEMLLDNSTVTGYSGGEVRFIQYDWPMGPTIDFLVTDEQPFLTMAGDYLLGAHFEFTYPIRITDRSNIKGSYDNKISTEYLPHLNIFTQTCGYSSGHYCSSGLESSGRVYPAGFYIYNNSVGNIWDMYWSNYAVWIVSNNTIYYRSNDGAVVALESGTPVGGQAIMQLPRFSTRDVASTSLPKIEGGDIFVFQAREHVGQIRTVEGILKEVFNNRRAVYLGFKNPHKGEFIVKIMMEDWDQFASPPEVIYQVGQRIRVSGKIEWFQGDPVIYVHHPSQIEIISK